MLCVRGDEVSPRHDDLENWPSLVAKEMDLINDEHSHRLDVGPVEEVYDMRVWGGRGDGEGGRGKGAGGRAEAVKI